ncbi:MAG: YncE family protein [Acidimicrobiales bacterium]
MSTEKGSLRSLASGRRAIAAVFGVIVLAAVLVTASAAALAEGGGNPPRPPQISGPPPPRYPVAPLTAYVANSGSDSVTVIDAATSTVEGSIAVGSDPSGIAANPNGSAVYVSDTDSNSVSVINPVTDAVSTIPLGFGTAPKGLAVTPNGSTLYVADSGTATVSVIDTTTDLVTTTIHVGLAPGSVAVGPVGAYAYVTNRVSGTVSVIATGTNTVYKTIATGYFPTDVIVNPTGKVAYVTNECGLNRYCWAPGRLTSIDLTTYTVSSNISVGYGPISVSETPNGGELYVVNSCGPAITPPPIPTPPGWPPPPNCGIKSNVTTLDAATLDVDFDPTIGYDQPGLVSGSAASPDGSLDYVVDSCGNDSSCGSDGTVSVFNTDIGTKPAATITVGSDPTAVAFAPPWVPPQDVGVLSTDAAPALAYVSGYVAAADQVGGAVYYQLYGAPAEWGGNQVPGASTPYSPAITAVGSTLWVAWTTSSFTVEYNELNINTNTWAFSSPQTVPQAGTNAGPALANVQGDVYLAWKGTSKGLVFYKFWNGKTWSGQATIGSYTTDATPAIAAAPGSSTIYAAWVESTGTSIQIASDGGTGFSSASTVPQAATNDGPALAVTSSGVYLSWTGATTSDIGWLFKSLIGWVPQQIVPGTQSGASPAMTAVGSNVFLAWQGQGSTDFWFTAFD